MIVTHYRIDLREIPKEHWNEASGMIKVVPKSPMLLRKEVERLAYYFKREFHYDFVQYQANDKEDYTAYLFTNEVRAFPRVWVGACCFRAREYKDIDFPVQSLQWMWIHPYYRSRGILTRQWPTLRENHGDFFQEPPISTAMLGFLLKHNTDSAFLPMYQTKGRMSDEEIKAMFVASVAKQKSNG